MKYARLVLAALVVPLIAGCSDASLAGGKGGKSAPAAAGSKASTGTSTGTKKKDPPDADADAGDDPIDVDDTESTDPTTTDTAGTTATATSTATAAACSPKIEKPDIRVGGTLVAELPIKENYATALGYIAKGPVYRAPAGATSVELTVAAGCHDPCRLSLVRSTQAVAVMTAFTINVDGTDQTFDPSGVAQTFDVNEKLVLVDPFATAAEASISICGTQLYVCQQGSTSGTVSGQCDAPN